MYKFYMSFKYNDQPKSAIIIESNFLNARQKLIDATTIAEDIFLEKIEEVG